jgi:polyhydroxyalkanoate synthase subunit PhaC
MNDRTSELAVEDPDMLASEAAAHFDARWQAQAARWTSGLLPVAQGLAWADWSMHLATQPAQSLRLAMRVQQKARRAWTASLAGQAPRDDVRYGAAAWRGWP